MVSPEFRQWLRFFFIVGLVGIFLLVSVHFIGGRVSAKALAQPAFQEDYPGTDFPTLPPYPGEDIPTSSAGVTASPTVGTVTASTATKTPVKTGTVGTVSPSASVTVGPSPTPASSLTGTATEVNVFLTENAEMGGSSITPPPSPTMESTGTTSPTPRPTRTRTPFVTLVSASSSEDGQNLDWGLFWIGFAVPVVMACGVVLYLLDRRPELFSFKRK